MTEATVGPKRPNEIWLQWDEAGSVPIAEVSWCQDKINESDIRYVHESAEADAKRLAAVVAGFGYNCGCKTWHIYECLPDGATSRAGCRGGPHECDETCVAARDALRQHRGADVGD